MPAPGYGLAAVTDFDRVRPPTCRAVTDTRRVTGLAIMTDPVIVTAAVSKCNCRKCFQYRLCRVKYENWVGSSSAPHPPDTTDCLETGHGATRASSRRSSTLFIDAGG